MSAPPGLPEAPRSVETLTDSEKRERETVRSVGRRDQDQDLRRKGEVSRCDDLYDRLGTTGVGTDQAHDTESVTGFEEEPSGSVSTGLEYKCKISK